jgi:hypothetical protein
MVSLKQRYTIKFICCLVLGMLAVSQVHAAIKGTPGSDHRHAWCKSKMDSCVEDANTDCDETYNWQSTENALCKSSEVKTCKDTYGSASDCLTRDRVTRGTRKTEAPEGQKVIVAPNNNTPSQKNKFKNKAPSTLPLSPKTSSIVRDHRKSTSTAPSKNSPISSGLVAPSALSVSNITRDTLGLSWRDNSNREFGVELYRVNPVEARLNPANSWKMIGKFEERVQSNVAGTGMRSDEDFDLRPGTNYCYRMRSYSGFDRSEVSGYSKVVCTMTRP